MPVFKFSLAGGGAISGEYLWGGVIIIGTYRIVVGDVVLLEKRNGNVITPGRRVTRTAEEHCKQRVITSSHLELANYGRPQAWTRGGT